MIIIEKDKHTINKQPFWNAHLDYHFWLLNQSFNNESNTFISLGDLFHNALPDPDEMDAIIALYEQSKFKKIYLLAGNHDWSDSKKSFSILPLRNNPRVELILEPCQKIIEGKKFMFMPHYVYSETFSPMKEYYQNPPQELIDNDYLCYHVEDETISFGKRKKGIDLSKWKGKRLGGHIHKIQHNYEIGMPIQSRFDEKGQKNNLFCISDKESFIDIPKFVDYYDIEYGQDVPEVEAKYPLWDIHNAPSVKAAKKLYSNLFIHKVYIANKKQEEVQAKKESGSKALMNYFNNYISKRNDVPQYIQDKLREIIAKR